MSEFGPKYDDKIDIFEFFEMLWDGKLVIIASMALATVMGFAYSQVVQPKYDVSVPYTSNIYSVNAQQICDRNPSCMETAVRKRLLSLLEGGWSSNFSLSTTAPLGLSEYQSQLERASVALTNEVYEEATTELAFIQTQLTDALLSTEIVASNMLHAMRIIQSIDNGQTAVSFGSVSVVKSSPKIPLIIALSVMLGGMVGVGFLIVQIAITKRKEQFAKS